MLKFTIPFLPHSINCANVMVRGMRNGRATVTVQQSSQTRAFKSQAKFYMPKYEFDPDKVYAITLRLCGNWLTQAQRPRDKDARNHGELVLEAILERYSCGRMGKMVVDAIFANYKTKDSLIWRDSIEKVQSVTERVEVEVSEYAPDGIPTS